MKMSELVALPQSPERVFGIVVDVPSFDPPAGLKEASILVPLNARGFDEDVLDVAIGWIVSPSPVDVTLEIAFDQVVDNPAYLMSVAASVGVGFSLLPPAFDCSDEQFDSYIERVLSFVGPYTSQANFSKMVPPITSYLGYLMVEALAPDMAAGFAPRDEYVVEKFDHAMPRERADLLKEKLRARLV